MDSSATYGRFATIASKRTSARKPCEQIAVDECDLIGESKHGNIVRCKLERLCTDVACGDLRVRQEMRQGAGDCAAARTHINDLCARVVRENRDAGQHKLFRLRAAAQARDGRRRFPSRKTPCGPRCRRPAHRSHAVRSTPAAVSCVGGRALRSPYAMTAEASSPVMNCASRRASSHGVGETPRNGRGETSMASAIVFGLGDGIAG